MDPKPLDSQNTRPLDNSKKYERIDPQVDRFKDIQVIELRVHPLISKQTRFRTSPAEEKAEQ